MKSKKKAIYFIILCPVALFLSGTFHRWNYSTFFRTGHHNKRLLEASRNDLIAVARQCLDRGADVNTRDKNGWAPLHFAATLGHKKMVGLLIEKGAKVNVCDCAGATPLHTAAGLGHLEIVAALLDHGAPVNVTNELGFTPLHMARSGSNVPVETLLLSRGANPEDVDMEAQAGLSEGTLALRDTLESGYPQMLEAFEEDGEDKG